MDRKMEAFHKDAALQAEKGNKTAGQRARCVSLEMEPLLKQFRKLSLAASKR
nr:histone H1 [uncultured Bacteroides sp.]